MKKAFASEGPWRTQCWSDIQMFSKEPADLRGKGERSKGGHGLEQEKRARERGELIYL